MYHDTNQEIHLASHTIHAKAKCICGADDVASVIRFWLVVGPTFPRHGCTKRWSRLKKCLQKSEFWTKQHWAPLKRGSTYFNFREKLENHDTQRMRGVPVDQRVWSDAPAK